MFEEKKRIQNLTGIASMNTHTSSFERPQKYKGEWHYKSVVDIEPSQSEQLKNIL